MSDHYQSAAYYIPVTAASANRQDIQHRFKHHDCRSSQASIECISLPTL